MKKQLGTWSTKGAGRQKVRNIELTRSWRTESEMHGAHKELENRRWGTWSTQSAGSQKVRNMEHTCCWKTEGEEHETHKELEYRR